MSVHKTIREALGNAHSHETAEGKQFWITAALVALDRIEAVADDEVREAIIEATAIVKTPPMVRQVTIDRDYLATLIHAATAPKNVEGE